MNENNNTLSGRIGKVVASHAAVARSSPAEVALIYTMHEQLREYCPWGWGGGETSQFDLRSLTPLSVAGCGWLQLGVSHLGYFSTLLQVVDNWTHILWY